MGTQAGCWNPLLQRSIIMLFEAAALQVLKHCTWTLSQLDRSAARQKESHAEGLAAFQAHKQVYAEQVVPLTSQHKQAEAALRLAQPKAATDAEVGSRQCSCLVEASHSKAGVMTGCSHPIDHHIRSSTLAMDGLLHLLHAFLSDIAHC